MAEKRERLDIIKDMLSVIMNHNNIGPTRLIQKSNLSPLMYKDYVMDLINNKLIIEVHDKNKKTYKLSEKGYAFLEKYDTFKNFIEELGL